MFGRRLFVFALTFLLTSLALVTEAWAGPRTKTPWEVTVIFLSSEDDDTVYQTDIDANLIELAELAPNENLKITVARLWPQRSYIFKPDPKSKSEVPFQTMLEGKAPFEVNVPGEFVESKVREAPAEFVAKALKAGFTSENSRRLLVFQTHGFGPKGIKQLKTKELKGLIEGVLPRKEGKLTDILWMDSCFMANLEFAVEFKNLAQFIISSEDSEFSTGAPFDGLNIVNEEEDATPLTLATILAQQYIGSYSTKEAGSQRRAVFSSAATVSVIETAKLDQVTKLSEQLSRDIKKLSDGEKTKLGRSLQTVKMELGHLVDFGRLLEKLKSSMGVASATPLLELLEVKNVKRLRTNPRVKVLSEVPGAKLVFGYDDFTKGDEKDAETLEKLPKNMKPVGFVPGPNGKSWPYRLINKRLYLNPYAPGMNRFSYYLEFDGQKSPITSVLRVADFLLRTRVSENNPVVLVGYSQAVGNAGEKYTGFGVLNPLVPKPDLDYMKLEFPARTGWGL